MSYNTVIEIRSRQKAMEFRNKEPWAAISVSSYQADLPQLSEDNRVGLLQLSFADCSNPRICSAEEIAKFSKAEAAQYAEAQARLFQASQAQQVLEFANQHWGNVEVLLVHCEAGLSRSPAIGAAISRIKLGPKSENWFFTRYMPNSYVYSMILRECYGEHSEEAEQARIKATGSAYGQVEDEPWDPAS